MSYLFLSCTEILDIGLTLCILVYTFIFQWCYDHIEDKFFPNAKAASLH
ncbi:hypothetical protein J519_2621 [Acinetobacter baumannii 1294217]|nr:hypothetical protein J543_3177 [Acinetobacter baumannii 1159076]EXA98448.1 hypothetical protein J519_2621 [Acinetobacter baumannii 1294217]